VAIIYNTDEKDYEIRKHKLQELVSERDVGEEYALTENEKAIREDNFIKNYFSNPYMMNVDLDERLTNKYFKALIKRYSINIYAFDRDGNPLRGTMNKDFDKLNRSRYYKKTQPITSSFYYLPLKENGEKYLGYFPINMDSTTVGYLFIEFVPKIFTSYSAYPELLLKNKNDYDEEFDQFSYAIYDNKYLVKQKGDYEYKLNFDFVQLKNSEYRTVKKDGYEHMIFFGKDKQVIITESERTLLNTLSVFSYAVLFFIVFFILIDYIGLVNKLWGDESIRQLFSGRTLQKQIQNSMIALVLFSLAVIGLVTLFYFQYQYDIYQNSRLLKKVNSVIKNFNQYYVDAYPQYREGSFDWVSKQKIKSLSNIYSLDINIYNEKGELMVTSQPEIFKRSLVATKMDPDAYIELCIHNKSKYVHDETIGKLKFLSAYQSFRANGKVYGYLNFPYYGKQKSFREDISYFLVALVNVYVLLLLAAALLAVFLSRTITNSLTLIAENIKGVELGKKNMPIEWKNEDEIGLLVKQYNSMLAELEKSAELLGRSEREGAWREMAKQVAHEIKNPLTPMKLSVQHLQRAMKENTPDVKELTEKVTERLIVQIDNLSNIATAFSDFAKMPHGDEEKIDLVPAIRATVELFSEMENIEFHFSLPLEPCYVLGDSNQWMRVCTNIIKNATQAIPENTKGRIDISLKVEEEHYVLAVKDNGVGIDGNKHTKIFEPNFTTKTSGTGLGLAIAKNIIEKMNGRIWFESNLNEYTVFYVELPKFAS
jgi:signal transduction histidine kinase